MSPSQGKMRGFPEICTTFLDLLEQQIWDNPNLQKIHSFFFVNLASRLWSLGQFVY